ARLLPALVDEVRIERPVLRNLQLLVPPDVAIGTGVDELFLARSLGGIDDDDAVGALGDRAVLRRHHAGCLVAVIAQHPYTGDVDHRRLAALLLQDVDPAVAMARHRRRVSGKYVADIFVHGRERAQLAVRALRNVDDQVPFAHGRTPFPSPSSGRVGWGLAD